MNREFLQALTHGGPSYGLEARDVSGGGVARGFLGALTHSGPSYASAPAREVAAGKADRDRVSRELAEAFAHWRAATHEVEVAMERMEAAGSVDDRRACFHSCVDVLERIVVITEEEVSPALRASYEATHPFDFPSRMLLKKTLKLTLRNAEMSTRLASILTMKKDLVLVRDAAAEKSVRAAYIEFSSLPDRRMGHLSHLVGAA